MEKSENKTTWKHAPTWLKGLMALAALAMAAHLALRCTGVAVWDDAYIFWRYAHHGLTHGTWSWNVGEPASHGMTSPAWTALLHLPSRMADAPLALWLCSLGCGILTLLLAWRMARALPALLAVLVLGASPLLASHFTSGMDTALCLAVGTGWLLLHRQGAAAWLLGLLAGLAWWVRPELAGLALGCLGMAALLRKEDRRRQLMALAMGMATLAGVLAVNAWALHSPVPLPLWSKWGRHSDAGIQAAYAGQGALQALWFLLILLPMAPLLHLSKVRQAAPYLLPAAALGLLYTVAVTPIMGMDARFHFHALPFWLMGALSMSSGPQFVSRLRWGAAASMAVVAFGILSWQQGRPASAMARLGKFHLAEVYVLQGGEANWPLLPTVSGLPLEASVATTELGMPGAWDPERRVIDLSLLTVDNPLAAVQLVPETIRQAPDVIWLHPHYTSMWQEFLSHPGFMGQYEWLPPGQTGAYQGLALRKSSPHFTSLRAAAALYIGAYSP